MVRGSYSTVATSKLPEATDGLYALACGLDKRVKRYTGCVSEGIRFHTKERERHRQTQNSGVLVEGVYEGNNELEFYGVIKDIVELNYGFKNSVLLFKCDWWDVGNNKTGIRTDAHFKSINASRNCYKDDPYVLASQVKQVFYLKDTKFRGDWQVIQNIRPRNMYDFPAMALTDEDVDTTEVAFQEEFQSGDRIVHNDGEERVLVALNRPGIEPNYVDASVVIPPVQLRHSDATFINDDDNDDDNFDDEDDTLIEYCSEEEELLPVDLDTDIDD